MSSCFRNFQAFNNVDAIFIFHGDPALAVVADGGKKKTKKKTVRDICALHIYFFQTQWKEKIDCSPLLSNGGLGVQQRAAMVQVPQSSVRSQPLLLLVCKSSSTLQVAGGRNVWTHHKLQTPTFSFSFFSFTRLRQTEIPARN